jgi:hypothetical protein
MMNIERSISAERKDHQQKSKALKSHEEESNT